MEGFAYSNEFCSTEGCPDYGNLQKDQSKPELAYNGINAKPPWTHSRRHVGSSFTQAHS